MLPIVGAEQIVFLLKAPVERPLRWSSDDFNEDLRMPAPIAAVVTG
jgi:hypothetical protein